MVNRKETNLDGVKAMARTLLYTDINKTAYSPMIVQHPFNGGNINARDYIDALQLEESEFDLIKYPERGTCLFKCGNERYLLQVKAPEYKSKLFGEAGGR